MADPFVYLVESPSPDDFYEDRCEGRAICEALKLLGINYSYTVTLDRQTFERAVRPGIGSRIASEAEKHRGEDGSYGAPIFHFSGHGNAEGIALLNNDLVTWNELREYLTPLNQIVPPGLMIALSSCGGSGANEMSRRLPHEKAFFGCVGSPNAIEWGDALVGFVTFYHRFFADFNPIAAVEAMKVASGEQSFSYRQGAEEQRYYLSQVQQQRGLFAPLGGAPTTYGQAHNN